MTNRLNLINESPCGKFILINPRTPEGTLTRHEWAILEDDSINLNLTTDLLRTISEDEMDATEEFFVWDESLLPLAKSR